MSHLEGAGSSPDIIGTGQGTSPSAPVPEASTQRKPGKRDRVALACQRCKSRKQKCDGQRPACASCARLSIKCTYIVPLLPAAGEKKAYIKALEQRVADLEATLASLGHQAVGSDHLPFYGHAAPLSQQHSVLSGSEPSSSSQQLQQVSDDEENDVVGAVRDLSLSAGGHYVGASSNITMGRVLSSVVHSQQSSAVPSPFGQNEPSAQTDEDPAPKSIYTLDMSGTLGDAQILLDQNTANRLISGWFRHIATRYPAIHSSRVMELHGNRESLIDFYDRAILHIIYAVSGRWLESAGEPGHFFSNQLYEVAFNEMDSILPMRNHQTVDYLLLMALYCTRAPRDPGAWTYVGAAMRLCIELGLHRRGPRRQSPSLQGEMNKRRFWTAYFLDRDISIAIGRPPSLSDHDIDAELPLDIDENTVSDEIVQQASLRVSNIPVNPPNTLTSFVHRTRLKQIESEIQHTVYRVDRREVIPDAVINDFLQRLHTWMHHIPLEANNYVQQQDTAYEGREFYTIHYHRCVRFLLYPQLEEIPVNQRYLSLCADACAGIISDYRRLHHVFPVGFSFLSIQSVFLAGLTMIYCAWLAPPNFIHVEAPLSDCQLLLYIITERYPSARKYRDVFERIKSAILNIIAQGKHQPRNPVNLGGNAQDTFNPVQQQWGPGMGEDFSFMINTMAGNNNTAPAAAQFNLGMDPATAALVGRHPNQPAPELGQYEAVWPGISQAMPHTMSNLDTMGGMFQ
ncbi:fungal-specific transcription factor domain-containing protein [Xylariomycetidae sp. FL2044]|nr:fungal-specific transcription factor domain-containing protein [Xylariomycetidae sp. FL2044]